MTTFKTLAAAALAAVTLANAAPAEAGGHSQCGYYAFGGAYQNYSNAKAQAVRLGAAIRDLDRSNSPNAGQGYWVVSYGPVNRWAAKSAANNWRWQGVHDAYVAKRCFF
ncbi:MAG: hypothetical protein AAFO73_04765 [Pseudomonadota bacterium]